jgi:ubiquinone/menaquinone biosynthesis C-methylase UbiE
LLTELRAAGTDRLLEIGIGTGRIARPLMERGVRVTGVDLAPLMVERLREQLTSQHTPPDLAFADATRLPFRDGSFRAALMVHVLHLVSDWRATIAELRRVLGAGGTFFHDVADYPAPNPWRKSLDKRPEILASLGVTSRTRPTPEQIAEALEAAGGVRRIVTYAQDEERNVPEHLVEAVRKRVDSWTWEIPEDVHPAFLEQFEAWCHECFGDMQREYVQSVRYELHVWSFA